MFGGVTSAVVIPPIVEEHKLTKNVETNLDMLVSSNYQVPNKKTNDISNEIIEENKQEADNSKPLTFRVERQEVSNGNLNGVEFVIVPSYDKDFSQWSKEEKEAYSLAIEEAKKLTIEEGKKMEAQEEQNMTDTIANLEKQIASYTDFIGFGSGNFRYNTYTKKYDGVFSYIERNTITNPDGSTTTTSTETCSETQEYSREEFREKIYPYLLEKIKSDFGNEEFVYSEYIPRLNELYHLSD